ncbi:MAG: hypothetical protein NTY41_08450 [Proteobacteria bacterium]|nr:hypothetical protein [Pseudomonadota bacterium]
MAKKHSTGNKWEEIDLFDYADAFSNIETLADRLMVKAPRDICDLIYSIRTIAKSRGNEMQSMSEIYTGVPTTVRIKKGGAV